MYIYIFSLFFQKVINWGSTHWTGQLLNGTKILIFFFFFFLFLSLSNFFVKKKKKKKSRKHIYWKLNIVFKKKKKKKKKSNIVCVWERQKQKFAKILKTKFQIRQP